MSFRPETFAAHFWSRTKLCDSGCIEWQGVKSKFGYGRVGRKQEGASRVAYRLTKGDPAGFYVCHACDNPACVNPDHLWLGTQRDNLRDMVAKGRHHGTKKTHCKNGHPFNSANTYRSSTPSGGIKRGCRRCNAEAVRRCKARKRGAQ